jgi:spermidine synthase
MATFVEATDASVRLKDLKLLERKHGTLQDIILYSHPSLGHILTIDGELQHVEAWQSLYHEPLVHVPASFIADIKTVLILGGGDLFAAREALKYPTVKEVRLVEHDQNMIDLTRTHYAHASTVLSDLRLAIDIADARVEFAKRCPKYDLVINDCFDLSLPSTHRSAYEALEQRLTPQGVCGDMVYRHVFYKRTVRRSLSALAKRSHLVLGLMTIPEYPGALHLQTLWGKNAHLSQTPRIIRNAVQRRFLSTRRGIEFDYYDPRFRNYFLYVPPYVRKAIA